MALCEHLTPTRPVASGNSGMNLHLSEVISLILEPVANVFKEGLEVISKDDMLSKVDDLNEKNAEWTPEKWWSGKGEGMPELCDCVGCKSEQGEHSENDMNELADESTEVKEQENTEVGNQGNSEVLRKKPGSDGLCHKAHFNLRFYKERRKKRFFRDFGWVEADLDRLISSKDVEIEDIHDFTLPMVIVGSDVEQLYPSLDAKRVSKMVYEAVLVADIKWESIDFLEVVRYIAIN